MAASTLYWTGGAGDNAFLTAGNWNTQRDGGGSALAPGAGGAGDTLYIESGNAAISGAVTGISVLNMYVTFGGTIGSPGTPLNIACTGTITVRTSSGNHYFQAVSAGTIVTMNVVQTGTGKLYLSGPGACTNFRVGINAQYDIGADCAVTTFESAGGTGDVAYNATVFTTATIASGSLRTYRGATTAFVGPQASLTTQGAKLAITTAHIWGKHYNWSTNISGTSTVATVGTSICYPGGMATAVGSPYAAVVTDRKTYEGSKHYLDSPSITFTNSAVPIGGAV